MEYETNDAETRRCYDATAPGSDAAGSHLYLRRRCVVYGSPAVPQARLCARSGQHSLRLCGPILIATDHFSDVGVKERRTYRLSSWRRGEARFES